MTYPASFAPDSKLSVHGRSIEKLYYIAISVVIALICFFIFLRIMNFDMRRDEQLYVPPIRLLSEYVLYNDFFYNHPPASAWYFYGFGKLFAPNHLLLSGRLAIFAVWLFFAIAIGGVVFALTRSALVSLCVVALSLMNDLFLTQAGVTATNNFIPLPFSFLGVALFLLALRSDHRRTLLAAVAGFFLALAVSFKLSAVAIIPPVALAAFLLPRALKLKDRVAGVVLPLLVGGVLGGTPILFYLLRDPGRFLAHVIGYHTGPHPQYWRLMSGDGEGGAMSLGQKLTLAQEIWFGPVVAVALAALLAIALTAIARRNDSEAPQRAVRLGEVVVLAGVVAFSVAFSFIPTPGFPQYFAPPLICLPLAFALLVEALGPGALPALRPIILAATLVVIAINGPRLGQYIGKALHPQQWTAVRVHDGGMVIADRLHAAGISGKVATLAPLYPLEGGLAVYAELATGPFAYRTGDMTSPELARYYTMTSPATVAALLERDPPAALLLGFDAELEKPLRAYAESHGYTPSAELGFKDRYGVPVLYLKPSAAP